MTDERVADAEQRAAALDPAQSFIVQAPAGSGKTELLIQRFLRLLALVEQPESIVAITFTRKAAGEMRGRILDALRRAEREPEPSAAHQAETWRLARAAARRGAERGWRLDQYPGRLRVQTIDSLCAALTRQMPLVAGFGAQPAIADDLNALYSDAARRTVAHVEADSEWGPAVEALIRHLDNDLVRLERLLVAMLAKRDQWLRQLAALDDPRLERAALEQALQAVIGDHLHTLSELIPASCGERLVALAQHAGGNLAAAGEQGDLAAWAERDSLPGNDIDELPAWRGLARLLLTNQGQWRRSLSKRDGFPPPSQAKDAAEKQRREATKEELKALLETFAENEPLRMRLAELAVLPAHGYGADEWAVLGALTQMLRLAAAELQLVFAERGQVDYTAVALAALEVLGPPEAPTDLALKLDYRIQHILVDEFQDTSFVQYRLVERLTAGWQPGDGRSLFVVGDPMQSIYRFRDAEVGLYLRARREGIGQILLEPLRLEVNFRSDPALVEWVNRVFPWVMAETEDPASGAVSYAPALACRTEINSSGGARLHPQIDAEPDAEAEQVVALIEDARRDAAAREHVPQEIAVLVRSRAHLAAIVPRLQRAGIAYRAVELEALADRQAIRDLAALTRALVHPADRPAWLAVLRAPWCGLNLADMSALAEGERDVTIWRLASDAQCRSRLSGEGNRRLGRVTEALAPFMASRRRQSLRALVEGAWLALAGPATLSGPRDLDDAATFFELLETLDEGWDLPEPAVLDARLAELFAQPDPAGDASLQLMTIHKAKGLEFDTVIVPGLGRGTRTSERELLQWTELSRSGGEAELLLAPIARAGEEPSPTYEYLRRLDAKKERHEMARVLYVACTRAKRRLHLLASVRGRQDENGMLQPGQPAKDSLLGRLWPGVEEQFMAAAEAIPVAWAGDTQTAGEEGAAHRLPRLPLGWQRPGPPAPVEWHGGDTVSEPDDEGLPLEFWWAGDTIRHVGTVVHRLLQRIAEDGREHWRGDDIRTRQPSLRRDLAELGVPEAELDAAVARAGEALERSLDEPTGRWLLSAHAEAETELAVSGIHGDRLVSVIIDRSFVDEHGVRWIVDYKTSTHTGGDPEAFLDREQERYRAQLERYAALMSALEDRPIRCGLYFPLLGGWREWAPRGAT